MAYRTETGDVVIPATVPNGTTTNTGYSFTVNAPSFNHKRPADREALVKALREDETFRTEMRTVITRIEADTALETAGLMEFTEAAVHPMTEAHVKSDGTALVKLIDPGWGSTGYYSQSVLERDLSKAFPKGTQMFWDHATPSEDRERPAGSLTKLAGVLTDDAKFMPNGPDGPGGYAPAKVFEAYRGAVKDMGGDIGVSVRWMGPEPKPGEAEGRRGPIVEGIDQGLSVDFVTVAGRGGKIVEAFESAGRRAAEKTEGAHVDAKEKEELEGQVAEARKAETEAKDRADRAEAALLVEAARREAVKVLSDEKPALPQVIASRIVESVVVGEIDRTEDGKLDPEKFTERVKAKAVSERDYLAAIRGSEGPVRGLGPSEPDEKEAEALAKATESAWDSLDESLGVKKEPAKA